jgi:hypothetical protein
MVNEILTVPPAAYFAAMAAQPVGECPARDWSKEHARGIWALEAVHAGQRIRRKTLNQMG